MKRLILSSKKNSDYVDDESTMKMTKRNLRDIKKCASYLLNNLSGDVNLEGWMLDKISVCKDDIREVKKEIEKDKEDESSPEEKFFVEGDDEK